ncbi:MAG: cohesin domain-containing protein [Candidatus Bathyarchaeia archaeon]|nr:cohesin domain-containing protein [Candidatus Bathyarchaeia archaeon]
MAGVGQNFTININISGVVDLYGWEFKLRWNSTLLDAVNVVEGSFLKQGGNTLFITPTINNTEGYMIVDCTLLGDIPGVSGNGTLATVEFHVKTVGECTLDLYDTILVSSAEQPIPHTAIDGYYYTLVRDVAVINLVASATTVNVTVENQGNQYTETFNVSTYYTLLTDPLIGTQTVTLEPGANATLVFTWTPPTCGRYEIHAEASIVPGEVDTTDNVRTLIIYISGGSSGGSSVGGCRGMLQ